MLKKFKMPGNLRITFNAPVTIVFSLICVLVMALDYFTKAHIVEKCFSAMGNSKSEMPFSFKDAAAIFRLVFHVFGHSSWNHLISNMAFILLLGPVIEEKYGSLRLGIMMFVTACVTGLLNGLFSPVTLTGSSDIAFMMILLASFTSLSKNEIPVSFIMIMILYLGREILGQEHNQNISTIAHIAGGLCGSLFAFVFTAKAERKEKAARKAAGTKKSRKETIREIDEASPRFQKNREQEKDEDNATLVGEIEL